MATTKETQPKLTAAQLRKKVEDLENKLQIIKDGAWCYLCDTHKARDKFYVSTDPLNQSGITPICKDCAKKLALSIGKDKVEHEPTKESVRLALRYLNKPFLENVWDASVAESENLASGKVKSNYWCSYAKNIAMGNWNCLTYADSDGLQSEKTEQLEEVQKENNNIVREKNQEILEQYKMNRRDTIHAIGYDPFENYPIEEDKPILYAQLNSFIDDETKNDGMKMGAVIQIVKKLNQAEKLNDQIDKYISDTTHAADNMPLIDKMASSSQKLMNVATTLAKDNGIKTIVPLQSDLHEKNPLNCWKTLKTIKPQRNDEICISVKVTKVEKINCMRVRLNPLLFFNGQSAAKPRIEEGSTTIPWVIEI